MIQGTACGEMDRMPGAITPRPIPVTPVVIRSKRDMPRRDRSRYVVLSTSDLQVNVAPSAGMSPDLHPDLLPTLKYPPAETGHHVRQLQQFRSFVSWATTVRGIGNDESLKGLHIDTYA